MCDNSNSSGGFAGGLLMAAGFAGVVMLPFLVLYRWGLGTLMLIVAPLLTAEWYVVDHTNLVKDAATSYGQIGQTCRLLIGMPWGFYLSLAWGLAILCGLAQALHMLPAMLSGHPDE